MITAALYALMLTPLFLFLCVLGTRVLEPMQIRSHLALIVAFAIVLLLVFAAIMLSILSLYLYRNLYREVEESLSPKSESLLAPRPRFETGIVSSTNAPNSLF